ncbi:MAG: HD domain-containing protein [Proteobacteria bacterium]|nr:HD domain-containing protein [Pseudomonadota bacterium]
MSAIDARDPYTRGHSVRVGHLSVDLGEALGLSAAQLQHLQIGGYLHDIGKIGIRDAVLLKPGKLTDEEFDLIRQHPTIGLDILRTLDLPPAVIAVVGGHHEKLNGAGYPLGLSAEELTIFPRMRYGSCAVAHSPIR